MNPLLHFDLLLHRIGQFFRFETFKLNQLMKGHKMDPITAIFTFLSSPVGQEICLQLLKAEEAFIGVISKLISHHAATLPALPSLPAQDVKNAADAKK